MKSLPFLLLSLSAVSLATQATDPAQAACELLKEALPDSVSFPGSPTYDQDIEHFVLSSTENATCSVEPGSAEDIAKILNIVGRDDIRSPFGVKSGGHAVNIGFSSTTGVEVAMSKFTAVVYDASSQTVKIEPANSWDQVYEKLEQFNITVAGGRVKGVGVGGLALGGGYSWITDEYGLTIDNVIAYDIVLPNGTFTSVTSQSSPELFFALKGGGNNFGIVTSFTMKAIPIGQVWGGPIVYGPESNALVAAAVSNYSVYNEDRKAQMNALYVSANGVSQWVVALFYDSPTPPPIYKSFLDIPSLASDVSARSFVEYMDAVVGPVPPTNLPQVSDTVPLIKYTPEIINAVTKNVDATYAQAVADNRNVTQVTFVVEPFVNAFSHSVPSAYPRDARRPVNPSNPEIAYSSVADGDYFRNALSKMSHAIQAVAVEEGQSLWTDICYSNYALGSTPLSLIYGDNLPRLKAIKKRVDPTNVMGLTGGFKL